MSKWLWYCSLCDLGLSTRLSLDNHVYGLKHRQAVEQAGLNSIEDGIDVLGSDASQRNQMAKLIRSDFIYVYDVPDSLDINQILLPFAKYVVTCIVVENPANKRMALFILLDIMKDIVWMELLNCLNVIGKAKVVFLQTSLTGCSPPYMERMKYILLYNLPEEEQMRREILEMLPVGRHDIYSFEESRFGGRAASFIFIRREENRPPVLMSLQNSIAASGEHSIGVNYLWVENGPPVTYATHLNGLTGREILNPLDEYGFEGSRYKLMYESASFIVFDDASSHADEDVPQNNSKQDDFGLSDFQIIQYPTSTFDSQVEFGHETKRSSNEDFFAPPPPKYLKPDPAWDRYLLPWKNTGGPVPTTPQGGKNLAYQTQASGLRYWVLRPFQPSRSSDEILSVLRPLLPLMDQAIVVLVTSKTFQLHKAVAFTELSADNYDAMSADVMRAENNLVLNPYLLARPCHYCVQCNQPHLDRFLPMDIMPWCPLSAHWGSEVETQFLFVGDISPLNLKVSETFQYISTYIPKFRAMLIPTIPRDSQNKRRPFFLHEEKSMDWVVLKFDNHTDCAQAFEYLVDSSRMTRLKPQYVCRLECVDILEGAVLIPVHNMLQWWTRNTAAAESDEDAIPICLEKNYCTPFHCNCHRQPGTIPVAPNKFELNSLAAFISSKARAKVITKPISESAIEFLSHIKK